MDDSSFCGTSMSEDKSSVAGCDSDSCLDDHILVDKLDKQKYDSSDMINDTNHAHMRRSLEEYYFEDGEKEEDEEDDLSEEALLEEMGYAKSADKIDIMKDHSKQYFDDEEEEEEEGGELSIEPTIHKPNTTPTANLNFVSALKGSREKEGLLAKGCRVSWSPDVYDPTPAPPEDFAISKNEIQVLEKKSSAGKNQQKKGKGGGGGKGKGADKSKGDRQVDKKQRKKHGGGNTSRRHVFDE